MNQVDSTSELQGIVLSTIGCMQLVALRLITQTMLQLYKAVVPPNKGLLGCGAAHRLYSSICKPISLYQQLKYHV